MSLIMKNLGKSAAPYADKMRKFRLKRLQISCLKFVKPEAKPSDEQISTTSSAAGSGLVFGHVSMMGRQREMEDTVTVAPLVEEKYSFFAVYDGHGGGEVAERCREKMHQYVAMHVKKETKKSPEEGGLDWEKVMAESFRSMEAEIKEECRGDEATQREKRMMGSTATVVLVGKEELVVANCGDSRAVLSRGGGVVLPLSTDHKVSVVKRTGSDEVLIIATDGLFDVVSNEVACDVVNRCLSGKIRRKEAELEESPVSAAAAVLAELAIAKGSRDNISVIVVEMK